MSNEVLPLRRDLRTRSKSMGVTIGASCACQTSIGRQDEALILGPGRCHLADQWKMGLRPDFVVTAGNLPLLLHLRPLR